MATPLTGSHSVHMAMDVAGRSRAHAALGDPHRLAVVDALAAGDRSFAELAAITGIKGNLLAHHLDVLERAALIERRVSEGDHRRRYITLRWAGLPPPPRGAKAPSGTIAFVCTHNSARSPFAAAWWKHTTGAEATSAGNQPADHVNATAARVASEFGLDLSSARPGGYDLLPTRPDLIVSVCDRALESGLPAAASYVHWSVRDPVAVGTDDSFRQAFEELKNRIDHLASQVGAA